MSKHNIAFGIAILALVIAGVALLVVSQASQSFGGTTEQQKKSFIVGLFAGNDRQFEVTKTGAVTAASFSATGDSTVSGGTLNVTTANSATSTLIAGCWQFYATSTATAHKFQASTTPGIMYSAYGTCPNL